MKKSVKQLCALGLSSSLLLGMTACQTQPDTEATPTPTAEQQQTAPKFVAGTYEGVGSGRNGDIHVTVTVSDEEITDIQIGEHLESKVLSDHAFTVIPEEILTYQTLSVDSVSGCTLSSFGVISAVENALTQAGAERKTLYTKVEKQAKEIAAPVEAEICIVGAGVAGLTAAVRALELGQNVVVFEQSGILGGSCAVASGQIMGAGTKMQEAAGIEDDAETYYQNIVDLMNGKDLPYPELTRAFADKSGEMIDWLDEYVGVSFGTRVPGLGLYTPPNRERIFWTQGGFNIVQPMIEILEKAVEDGRASLYMNTEVTHVLKNAEGAVSGVTVVNENGEEQDYDFSAVILACGGFCHNEEMLKEYCGYTNVGSGAPNTSKGSNVTLGEDTGAQLAMIGASATYPGAVPEAGFDVRYKVAFTYPGSILLNNNGERYVNETSSAVTMGYATNDSNEVFVVFTEAMRDETQNILSITGYNEANLTPEESWALLDSLAERNNCVYKADTIEELAEKMGVPADTLKQTIETYNGYAESGVDEDFGRSNMVALSEGPYYAIYSIPYVIQTAGGILIDTSARVQDENDQTIVGLYACGEAVGMNLACPPGHGGKSIGSGTIWGMLAAETAVSELG